jgi:hypothetical protein
LKSTDEAVRKYFIYILKLENQSWYVGTAKALRTRLRDHAKKSEYSLIKLHKNPVYRNTGLTGKRKATHLYAAFETACDCFQVTEIENAITVAMGNKYGFNKVRGGIWIKSWDLIIKPEVINDLKNRFENIEIRKQYNLIKIDIKNEKPFALPIYERQ